MADLSDVLTAYATAAAAALYPTTPGTSTTPSPVAGLVVTIGVGWPSPQSLDAILANGYGMVTAFAAPGMERNTTRYPQEEQVGTLNPATITLTAAGYVVTLGGTTAAYAQNIGAFVNGAPYVVSVPANTSLTAAAVLFAAAFAGATSTGPAVTFPSGSIIGALRTGGAASTITEVRRQERMVQLIVWAPTPTARDAIVQPIDIALADLPFLSAADGSPIRSIYHRTLLIDSDQKQGLFRRDLYYLAEYPTTKTGTATQITVVEASQSLVDAAGDVLSGPTVSYD